MFFFGSTKFEKKNVFQNEKIIDSPGNLLPSILSNCKLYFIPKLSKYLTHIKPKQEALAADIL